MKHRSVSERPADTITGFSGRMSFVFVHVVWFAIWILIKYDLTPLSTLESVFQPVSCRHLDQRRTRIVWEQST